MEKGTQFLRSLDDNCPHCEVLRKAEVKLHAEARGTTVYIVCLACGFEMTDADYSSPKTIGKL